MPRNQQFKQYSNGSDPRPSEDNGRPPEHREPEYDDGGDESYDDGYAGYNRIYDEDLDYHAEHRSPPPDDDEDVEDVEDVDIMEVLDHDDLTQMDGPDA